MSDSQVGRLTLDPGGEISLRWTKAWNGLLTIKGQDFRASHSHHVHDYYSICLVDHGEAEVIARGESFHVRPGSVILISPYEVHAEESNRAAGWSFRGMSPRPATLKRVLGGEFARALGALRFKSPVVNDSALADHLDCLFTTLERSTEGVAGERILEDTRESLRRQMEPVARSSRLRRARRATELARARIHDGGKGMPSIAELSSLTGMSRYHLSRTFRDVVGLPPYAYYAQVRMAWAKVFLRHGYPLSAVAMQLGYSDQSHFHRQFRELSATTPGRYARALHSVFRGQPVAEPFNGARPLIPADSG
jgi:AraC-like DNA-binding protein